MRIKGDGASVAIMPQYEIAATIATKLDALCYGERDTDALQYEVCSETIGCILDDTCSFLQ